MSKLFSLNTKVVIVVFIFLDLFCIGLGMGVPFFPIFLGFFIGWYGTKRTLITQPSIKKGMTGILKISSLTTFFTFLVMCCIWGPIFPKIFDPSYDFNNFGIPFILYDAKASFIGWIILMIVISPFLQLLTTIFSSFITLFIHSGNNSKLKS
jgi:hypothetical protein